jgi:hypothetical protein
VPTDVANLPHSFGTFFYPRTFSEWLSWLRVTRPLLERQPTGVGQNVGLLELLPQFTWVVSEFLCRRGKGLDLIILQNISDLVAAGRSRFRDLYFSPSQTSRPAYLACNTLLLCSSGVSRVGWTLSCCSLYAPLGPR